MRCEQVFFALLFYFILFHFYIYLFYFIFCSCDNLSDTNEFCHFLTGTAFSALLLLLNKEANHVKSNFAQNTSSIERSDENVLVGTVLSIYRSSLSVCVCIHSAALKSLPPALLGYF